MLALARYRAMTCPGCGGWLPDTTDPSADDDYVIADPVRCHRCTAHEIAADRAATYPHPRALMLQVRRRPHH